MTRTSSYPILPLIINRWSPRAMSGETITDQELFTLFEAARWAQSSYNNQPWRFIYGKRGTDAWQHLFDLLVPFNQEWCNNSAVLILVASHKHFEFNEKESRTHSFDTGAACQNMALQAYSMNLVCHGMEGFDYERARIVARLSDHFDVEALFAVGKPVQVTVLSAELQKRETPSDRLPLEKLIFEGYLKN